MKKTFTHQTEWSDLSDYSPQSRGQLPDYVVLPDGERVDLELNDPEAPRSRAGYIQIHNNVRVRYTYWGDDGTSRRGRAGGKSEILCPKDSVFLFETRCPMCGDTTGLVPEDKLDRLGRAPQKWHTECRAEAEYRERF